MRDNVTATAADANPDFGVSSFDDQMHASLAIFQVRLTPTPTLTLALALALTLALTLTISQVWTGVGWTDLAYKVMDAHSEMWSYFFTLTFLLGAWFLTNLVSPNPNPNPNPKPETHPQPQP